MFILAKMIKAAIRQDGFVGAIIYGNQGYGKSVYALKTAFQVYRDWDIVFSNLVFRLEDLYDKLLSAITNRKPIQVLIWDDAGVHGNKYKWFDPKGQSLAKDMQMLIDVIRTGVKSLLITTPQPNELLRVFRGYDWYYIKITKMGDKNNRQATLYRQSVMPNGNIIVRKIGIDRYNVRLPDEIYDWYKPIRESFFQEVLMRIKPT